MKIRNIILISFLSLGLSCGDNFVDTLPLGASTPKNTDDLAKLINLRNNVNIGGNNFTEQCDDYLIPDNKVQYNKSYTWQDQIYTEIESDKDWNNNYKIISIANFVLNHIDSYSKGYQFKVQNTKGRALFLRANAYFYLVNGYAKNYNTATAVRDLGMPMPLEMDIHAQLPRSTVQQVYDLIIKDLNQAISLIDTTPTKDPGYWPCKAAAYALLGRVYLYQNNYAQSAEKSKQALDLYNSLIDYNTITYADPKSKNPAAGITGYYSMSNQENLFISNSGQYITEIFCSKSLINVFDKEKDLRYRYFIADRDQTGTSLKGLYIPVNSNKDEWSGISTPEVYLNYAEALMRQSLPKIQEALIWLNKLRKNRYDTSTYQPYTASNPSEVLKEVMLERRRELRFTAWRWFDMKRLGVSCTRTVEGKTYTLKATSNNYVWPIPPNVMAMNPLLKQNPRGL